MKRQLILFFSALVVLTSWSQQTDGERTKAYVDFLYRYMPLCDKADHSVAFFRANAALTQRAVSEMPWGSQLSDTLIRHFVLPLRVNNEPLDSFRIKFYDTLKARVEGLDMRRAALEINHWCHEHVTYQPSDGRTSSPLQSLRTAYGRCGEESTLCVAAMRVVGIPARQVYTPRWAHTDDNHAWVEVWIEGAWHFMGACEPEPVLDLGWFNGPASRGMMMHTRVFGHYEGKEDIVLQTPTYTEINVTPNYAQTRKVNISVTDTEGQPVANAKVEFKIYNYAEFYTAVTRYTDVNGRTALSSGMGDLLVWASKNGKFGFKKVSFASADHETICLEHNSATSIVCDLDISVPPQKYTLPRVSESQRAENDRRLAREDSLRLAYELTMPQAKNLPKTKQSELLAKSRGNHRVVSQFMDDYGAAALPLLETLSEKDLRDIEYNILLDHQLHSPRRPNVTDDDYRHYVLCPRVALEPLSPYKAFFQQQHFRFSSADAVENWCRNNLIIDSLHNQNGTFITPIGVMRTKVCDLRSHNVFFVSVCRANGIPAWIDPVTEKVCTREWEIQEGTEAQSQSVISHQAPKLSLEGDNSLKYYVDFTLSKIENGELKLLNFPEEATMHHFADGVPLEEGHYLLTTGTRRPDGGVLAKVRSFKHSTARPAHIKVILRPYEAAHNSFGHIEGFDRPCVIVLLAEGQEPSNHVVRDIAARKADFERLGIDITCSFGSEEQLKKFLSQDFPPMPKQTRWQSHATGMLHDTIARALPLHNASNLPIVVVVNKDGDIPFYRQGYTIGIGDEILKVMEQR
ncbi:MAG: transglutaminase domain-containing protein [Bacteroidaceae bacterium]|nr:transglutaminase domain-containing protein [Bacteroidaceae bacterium]